MDSEVVKLFDGYFLFVLTLKFIFIAQVLKLHRRESAVAHEYEPQLSRWSSADSRGIKGAWLDTGAKLLQDLFAAARRIEIKAIINVFNAEILARKHQKGILLRWQ